MKTFKFYSDAGHGWLAVKKDLLVELGIADKITSYSYTKGKTVYLEEDCDLSTFYKAYGAGFNTITKYSKGQSPIRSYACYNSNQ